MGTASSRSGGLTREDGADDGVATAGSPLSAKADHSWRHRGDHMPGRKTIEGRGGGRGRVMRRTKEGASSPAWHTTQQASGVMSQARHAYSGPGIGEQVARM